MKANKKIICLIVILVIVLIALLIASSMIPKDAENKIVEEVFDSEGNKIEIGSSSFNTIDDAASYYNMTFKKLVQSEQKDFVSDIYVIFHKELKLENEIFFDSYVKAMTLQMKYNNFRMIDETNKITIEVYCDNANRKIEKIVINGDENYFTKLETAKQIEEFEATQITEVMVEAEELKHFIENDWKITQEEIKSNQTTSIEDTDEYSLYKEYVKVKIVDGKVFNLVFDTKYDKTVVDGLKTTSSDEEIKKILGNPIFKDSNIYGYKTEKFYIFFTGEQISIYRIDFADDKVLQNALEDLNKDKNIVNFAKNVLASWKDYDNVYNQGEKIELTYTLKGIKIQNTNAFNPNIVIYSNYEGIVLDNKKLENIQDANLPIQIQLDLETNLIFEYEKARHEKNIILNEYHN